MIRKKIFSFSLLTLLLTLTSCKTTYENRAYVVECNEVSTDVERNLANVTEYETNIVAKTTFTHEKDNSYNYEYKKNEKLSYKAYLDNTTELTTIYDDTYTYSNSINRNYSKEKTISTFALRNDNQNKYVYLSKIFKKTSPSSKYYGISYSTDDFGYNHLELESAYKEKKISNVNHSLYDAPAYGKITFTNAFNLYKVDDNNYVYHNSYSRDDGSTSYVSNLGFYSIDSKYTRDDKLGFVITDISIILKSRSYNNLGDETITEIKDDISFKYGKFKNSVYKLEDKPSYTDYAYYHNLASTITYNDKTENFINSSSDYQEKNKEGYYLQTKLNLRAPQNDDEVNTYLANIKYYDFDNNSFADVPKSYFTDSSKNLINFHNISTSSFTVKESGYYLFECFFDKDYKLTKVAINSNNNY